MRALYLAATQRSSGKTTVALGLGAALRQSGRVVQPFKKGPDFIDPMWLGEAAGRPCRHLDFTTQGPDEMQGAFHRHLGGADVGLVEGNSGLFDGTDPEGTNTNAALARLLGVPVVLVVNCRGINRGIAPLLLGYRAFDPDLPIAGVILNQVAGARHEGKLRAAVERYTDVPVLGALHQDGALAIPERHLGLVPQAEAAASEAIIRRLGETVAAQVDLTALLESAGEVDSGDFAPPPPTPAQRDLRIGYARDAAFHFYYPDDLEALAAGGAELVPVDTLNDSRLPEIDGLFLGGGFPEIEMAALEANAPLRADIRAACEAGLPVYAECGGLMYLCRSLTWGGRQAAMAGVLPADAVMEERPQGKGYVLLRDRATGPWPGLAGTDGVVPAHEFHHSRLVNLDPDAEFAYDILRGHGIDGAHDGLVRRNVLACYAHLRHVAADPWTDRFLGLVRARKARQVKRVEATAEG